MSRKPYKTSDIDEIRRLIGTGPDVEGHQFSIEEIIDEVRNGEKQSGSAHLSDPRDVPPDIAAPESAKPAGPRPQESAKKTVRVQDSEAPAGVAWRQEVFYEIPPAQQKRPKKGKPEQPPEKTDVFEIDQKVFKEFETSLPEGFAGISEDAFAPREPSAPRKPIHIFGKRQQQDLPEDDTGKYDRLQYKTPKEAIEALTAAERSAASRSVFVFILSCVAAYMTLAPQLKLYLPERFNYLSVPYLYLLLLATVQTACMICAADIIAEGLYHIFRLRPRLNSILALSGLSVLTHIFTVIVFPEWGGFLPFAAVSCFCIFFALLGKAQGCSAKRRAYKSVTLSANPTAVKWEEYHEKKRRAFKAKLGSLDGFMIGMEEKDKAEKTAAFYAPVAISAAFVLSAVSSFGQNRPHLFFWSLSAMFSVLLPFSFFISASWAYKAVSRRLSSLGAAISGWNCVRELSRIREAAVCDQDLYPTGAVSINGLKVIGSSSFEKVVAYATSMCLESGLGLAGSFTELLEKNFLKPAEVKNLKHYDTGGMTGEINGDYVVMGTLGFLMRLGIRVTEGLSIKNGVFIAVNTEFSGVFALKYQQLPQQAAAFSLLRHSRVSPVLYTRDFNITPGMVESRFRLGHGTIEYPEILDRISLSDREYGMELDPAAVMARDGFLPYAEILVAAKRLNSAVVKNVSVSIVSAVTGMLLMFYLTSKAAVVSATPYNTLIFLALWLLPAVWISFKSSKY